MMQDAKMALTEPMLQDTVSRGVHHRWKRLALVSVLAGVSFGVVLGWAPLPADQQFQKPLNAIAWPYMSTAKQSQFVQPATRFMTPTMSRPSTHQVNVHRLPGPEFKPESKMEKEELQIQESNSVAGLAEATPARRNVILGALSAAAFTTDGAGRSYLQKMGEKTINTVREVSEAITRPKIVVAGATGLLGSRVIERLAARGGLDVVGAVHNVEKAKKVFQGFLDAMPDVLDIMPSASKIASGMEDSAVSLAKLDVVKESVEAIAETLKGANSLVIAIGYIPGDPLSWGKAARAVDNEGTIKLIDAAKVAGVSKIVMVSAILTDAGSWGQSKATVYRATNFFGRVLDEKLVAEKHLRASGLDYTILRAGGYIENGFRNGDKFSKPGQLVISGENTLKEGEISRDRMADVCVDALFDPDLNNKVVEIVERFA
jgi:uncharacterized protein YbjT (DUF2867 family)